MNVNVLLVDDFLMDPVRVRASALAAGIGTWLPNKGKVGSSVYEGMGFVGDHSIVVQQLANVLGGHIFPNLMFFRATNIGMEKAYVHSDRHSGSMTSIVYLSEHTGDIVSGTAFFRHKKYNLTEMPTLEELQEKGIFDELKRDMEEGSGGDAWEQIDFVRGLFNRALVFRAPLFHARMPRDGFGSTEQEARLVHVCHFERG